MLKFTTEKSRYAAMKTISRHLRNEMKNLLCCIKKGKNKVENMKAGDSLPNGGCMPFELFLPEEFTMTGFE